MSDNNLIKDRKETELLEVIKEEETRIQQIEEGLKKRESRANRIKEFFAKEKSFWGSKQKVRDFKEPLMILMRNSVMDEFYEDASKGRFNFIHSDGEERYLLLDPRFLRSLPYGGKVIKYYCCHEDYPLPLPENPALSSEKFHTAIERITSLEKEYKAKELRIRGEMWWKILTGIAIIIGVFVLGGLTGAFEWVADFFRGNPEPAQQIQRTATVVGALLMKVRKKIW